MNFSSLSIKYPIPAIMLFALLTLAGLMAYRANGVQDFPDIELPIVTVTADLGDQHHFEFVADAGDQR